MIVPQRKPRLDAETAKQWIRTALKDIFENTAPTRARNFILAEEFFLDCCEAANVSPEKVREYMRQREISKGIESLEDDLAALW